MTAFAEPLQTPFNRVLKFRGENSTFAYDISYTWYNWCLEALGHSYLYGSIVKTADLNSSAKKKKKKKLKKTLKKTPKKIAC